jgi:hypothetical protein
MMKVLAIMFLLLVSILAQTNTTLNITASDAPVLNITQLITTDFQAQVNALMKQNGATKTLSDLLIVQDPVANLTVD